MDRKQISISEIMEDPLPGKAPESKFMDRDIMKLSDVMNSPMDASIPKAVQEMLSLIYLSTEVVKENSMLFKNMTYDRIMEDEVFVILFIKRISVYYGISMREASLLAESLKFKLPTKILEHIRIPGMALTNILKRFMNNPTRIESARRGQIKRAENYLTKEVVITYKGKDSEYTVSIDRVKELFAKRVQNGAKIFNFLLQKLNEQNYQENTRFLLSELVEAGIYANTDSAYRGLKTVLDKFMHIYIEGTAIEYANKKLKETQFRKATLVSDIYVSHKQCFVVLPQIIRSSAHYITILPSWSYTLTNESAYLLLDYIYYLARQNYEKITARNCFTIGLNSIRQHLGLASPDEVHKGNYNKIIVKPIEDAISAIEEAQARQSYDELSITPFYNFEYANIHEYLDGYLEIGVSGELFSYMEQRASKKLEKTNEMDQLRDRGDGGVH